ncbi:MAG: hypothetical protein J6W33_02005 [Spirochaetia bacterium]|nr:hypothetical protein [Spirochaetia bacterium]
MMIFKKYKAVYLGLKRWRITAPDGFQFDITAKDGIADVLWSIERWRKMGWA